jgi:surface antigen
MDIMKTASRLPLVLVLALLLALDAAVAAADDGGRHGRQREFAERKEEFRDGPCKVKLEWKKNGDYLEERDCDGLGDRYPERKERFHERGCKIEREWKKDGDYKEERKCGGRDGRGQRGTPPHGPPGVYPPWIVVDRGEPVYRPGREPVPLPPAPPVPVLQCRSEAVGRVLGGIAGAVIGGRVAGPEQRAIGSIGGAIAGVLIGGEIGRRIDRADQACIGQALEFGARGQRVQWASGEQQFAVVPGASVQRGGRACRDYEAEVLTAAGWQKTRGTACRQPDGVWVAG